MRKLLILSVLTVLAGAAAGCSCGRSACGPSYGCGTCSLSRFRLPSVARHDCCPPTYQATCQPACQPACQSDCGCDTCGSSGGSYMGGTVMNGGVMSGPVGVTSNSMMMPAETGSCCNN